ncbi:uncharacterized protein LOC101846162 [Aplysia californica]|uniref:Uncharacterized protein LOC101846162 n=1 Tax=Aplysia californica TaxID=6500 RepID=A0ABM0K281_APLCA|nr:uncharacterized protein LOC101846162 [Aplysia californica]
MTQGGESRKEATKPRNLSTRKTTRLGTWNVRTMYEAGKALHVAREMEGYQLDILGLCETRWTTAGECQLASVETVLYSGHLEENSRHTEGVGILLSTHAKRVLIGWKAEGPRQISAEFRSQKKDINLHVIQGYATTNDKDQDVKETFYKMLKNTIDQVRRKDILILMGDFNAKVGSDNVGFEEIIGKHGLVVRNENGELFAEICATNGLVIGGTVFPHKQIHKSTWASPDQQTENQIDHMCQQEIQGINEGFRYNVEFLREPSSREEFNVAVKNRFQVLETLGEDSSVEETWEAIKKGWTTVCQEVQGKRKREHKPWISVTTLRKIEERKKKKDQVNRSKTRAGKAKAQEEYTKAMKEVKVSVRKDKRNYVDDLARGAEEAAGAGNMRGLYETTKKLAGRYKNAGVPVKDKDGKLLTNPDEQKERWKEHFKELLSRPRPENSLTFHQQRLIWG